MYKEYIHDTYTWTYLCTTTCTCVMHTIFKDLLLARIEQGESTDGSATHFNRLSETDGTRTFLADGSDDDDHDDDDDESEEKVSDFL